MVSLSDEFYAQRLNLDGWKLWYSARKDTHVVAGPTACRYGEDYWHLDGPDDIRVYQRQESEEERYVFNVYDGHYLVGSSVVIVEPVSALEDTKLRADPAIPFGGPYLHAPNGNSHVAMMSSMYVVPGKPASVFFALLEPIRNLGLPTYALLANKRLIPIVERRYSPSVNDVTKVVT